MKSRFVVGVIAGMLTVASASVLAQSAGSSTSGSAGVSEPPRSLGSLGYGRPGVQDSTLYGASSPGVGGANQVEGVISCASYPTYPGCQAPPPPPPPPDPPTPPGGGQSGDPTANVVATCQFTGNKGFGTTEAQTNKAGTCSQWGEFTSTPSGLSIAGVLAVGDTTSGNAKFIWPSFADPSQWSISWSGGCTGSGPTCQTGFKPVDWRGTGADFSATVTVRHIPTGKQTSRSVSASFFVCGVRGRYECP